jgi:hypothetical protein
MSLTGLLVVYILDTIEFEIISLPNNCNSVNDKSVCPFVDNNFSKCETNVLKLSCE